MRVPEELAKVLEEDAVAFRRKFGREPGPEDPLLYDPDQDVPTPLLGEAVYRAGLDRFLRAHDVYGLDPEAVLLLWAHTLVDDPDAFRGRPDEEALNRDCRETREFWDSRTPEERKRIIEGIREWVRFGTGLVPPRLVKRDVELAEDDSQRARDPANRKDGTA